MHMYLSLSLYNMYIYIYIYIHINISLSLSICIYIYICTFLHRQVVGLRLRRSQAPARGDLCRGRGDLLHPQGLGD